jgi:hypothetical protein
MKTIEVTIVRTQVTELEVDDDFNLTQADPTFHYLDQNVLDNQRDEDEESHTVTMKEVEQDAPYFEPQSSFFAGGSM